MKRDQLIESAIMARTTEQAATVQDMIAKRLGGRNQRPVGDKPNNSGLLKGAGGSYDHKVFENVTNMQDAVLELHALKKFGATTNVPYRTPQEAAKDLLTGLDYRQRAALATVTLDVCDDQTPLSKLQRMTISFRDQGCGLTPRQVPETIFGVGGNHKDEVQWLQGAYGLGGATTYRNAKAVVLVTRRHPDLLDGAEDRITVAVVEWKQHGKNDGAFYLVESPWQKLGDNPMPFSIPSRSFPEFEPGTHLSLISYGVEGYHRARGGDEKSFGSVADTRLYRPAIPTKLVDNAHPKADDRYLQGLERRLSDNPREDRIEGEVQYMPFKVEEKTFHLPLRYWVFAKSGEPGQRKSSVANGHALLMVSNGQVHAHWAPQEFRRRTSLKHLDDRILVVVEMDEIPIEVRTALFTADRSETIRTATAIRLEENIEQFLSSWTELLDIERKLTREAISKSGDARSTRQVAEQISRAFNFKGYGSGKGGKKGGSPDDNPKRERPPRKPVDLYRDPTTIEGPDVVVTQPGQTKSVNYSINAVDDFIPRRADLTVVCDHPDVDPADIAVGRLRNGRVRVSVAFAEDAQLGAFTMRVMVKDWLKVSGALGPDLEWESKLEVIPEVKRKTRPRGDSSSGQSGPTEGGAVAMVWRPVGDEDLDWNKSTVGAVEYPTASALAAERSSDYGNLEALGDVKVPTLVLNSDYSRLTKYLEMRVKEAREETVNKLRDEYAVGVGVGMLILEEDSDQRRKRGEDALGDEARTAANQAIARSVLSMLPRFDALMKETELE